MRSDSAPTFPAIPGYELLDVIGRGGMGIVYRAVNLRLNREVAVKLLGDRYAWDDSAAERFTAEAQITGQLQHPGIPALHELGTLADGRPFLAMKLVKGRTLQQLVEETGKASEEETWGRHLAIFEHICHAVGYAHAQKIIHRDLKPANVMVGAFGEVQVMDWGLAKVLSAPQPEPERVSDATLPLDPNATMPELDPPLIKPNATRTGTVLGTPAFMPPEQAAGAVELLDQRSDVFSLGAILCVLLTGRPPYAGASAVEVVHRAARGELADALARLDASGAEPAVIALAKACLATQQAERPKDGQAVAEEIARIRFQAEARARQAEQERAAAVVREAEQRKRRRVWAGLAATLLLGLVGLIAGVILLFGLNQQLEAANANLAGALSKEQLARTRADANFKHALDTVKAQVFDITNELRHRAGTRDLCAKMQNTAVARLKSLVDLAAPPDASGAERTAFWAHVNRGDVYKDVDLKPSLARVEYEKAHAIAEQLAAAKPDDLQAQRDLALSHSNLGEVSRQTGDTAAALRHYADSLEILRRLAADEPTDPETQRQLTISLNHLGDVRLQLGDVAAAKTHYIESLNIRTKLASAEPANQLAQRSRSISLIKLGDLSRQLGESAAARDYFNQHHALCQQLVTADPNDAQAQRDLSIACDRLGDLSRQDGDTTMAAKHYANALTIREQLAEPDPRDAQAQRGLAVSQLKLGDLRRQLGDAAGALAHYTQHHAISKQLADADPQDAQSQHDLFAAADRLGSLSLQTGAASAAAVYFADGLDICEKLVAANPRDAVAQRELAVCHDRLGDVRRQTGQLLEARKHFGESLTVRRQLAQADPADVQAQTDLFVSCWKLAAVEQQAGRYRQAADWLRQGLEVLRPLQAAGKLHGQFKNAVAAQERHLAACELLARLAPALWDDPAWAMLWGTPRF
jgi:tetratricopeptide (TPR) repeat protein